MTSDRDPLREGPAPAGPFDIAIVGAGVVGCATARELTRRGASCVLIDKARDVGTGTSKANTAILHTGFDAKPGTLEAELVPRGHELLRVYAGRVGIPTASTGALMVAWSGEQLEALSAIESGAVENGYRDARRVEAEELYEREPALGPGAHGALEIPGEGIVCPWTTTLALATEAVMNGCRLVLDAGVAAVERGARFELRTSRGPIVADHLVNAAGLRSDELDAMLGHREFTVRPRRGELIVFDKLARSLVNHVLLPVPTEKTKGVLVAPTVYGNLLLGPTAEDIDSRDDRSTTADGLALPACRRRPDRPRARGARGDGDVRRAAGRDRGPRLPAPCARGASATFAPGGSAPPGCRRRWRSPSECGRGSPPPGWSCRRRRPGRSRGCRTSARPLRVRSSVPS